MSYNADVDERHEEPVFKDTQPALKLPSQPPSEYEHDGFTSQNRNEKTSEKEQEKIQEKSPSQPPEYLMQMANERNYLLQTNQSGHTNVHELALRVSNKEVIQRAILTLQKDNFVADAGRQNSFGHSPIFLSIIARNKTFALEFLKAGAPIFQSDYLGKTIFHYLAEYNAQNFTKEIFDSHTFPTETSRILQIWDVQGFTPIQVAVREGNMVAFHNFSKYGGGQLYQKDKKRGYTLLHLAVENGNRYLVDLLLAMKDANIDVDESGADEATPLHLAVANGYLDIVSVLLDSKADPTILLREHSILGLAPEENEVQLRALIARKVSPSIYIFLSEYVDSDMEDD